MLSALTDVVSMADRCRGVIVRGWLLMAFPCLLVALAPVPARASGDMCMPGWTLDFARMPECANIAALVPGNDTRANLLLLLADRHGAPATTAPAPQPLLDWRSFRARFAGPLPAVDGDYASGEGSRCRSLVPGAKAFGAALQTAAGLSPDERKALAGARDSLARRCDSTPNAAASPAPAPTPAPDTPAQVASPEGRAFAAYLRAADGFYAGDFDAAKPGFAGLRSDPNPWLADTAAYMVARTAVNALQANAFDEYGTFKGSTAVDQTAAHATAADLDAYVKDHPDGLYVASARGLQRRVGWLAGWTANLAPRYAALIAQSPADRGMDDAALADEIDSKLLPTLTLAMTRDPILLAVLDLKAIRRAAPGEPQPPQPDLAAQRDALAAIPGLYEFLVATAAFYTGNSPTTVIGTVPDDTRRRDGDTLWFSRQLLRGLALEATGDRNARGFWKELLPGAARPLERAAAELALALDDERRGDMEDAFGAGSSVQNPAMRAILLTHDAAAPLLRARATDAGAPARERQVALFTLLTKELTHGFYGDFLSDAAHVPADATKEGAVEIDPLGDDTVPLGLFVRGETAGDIACPALAVTAARLESHPDSVRDRLCLSEWIRLNGFTPDSNDVPLSKRDLGFGPSAFAGKASTRSSIYRAVIADRAASPDERAFALFRAVKCYEPSGGNRCGSPDVPKAERRDWYDTLNRSYPGSRWTRQLRHWW